jgi:predicted pyridoxine 5'-phosphate oxidase superfamily flavin-nucleotide-binding protein
LGFVDYAGNKQYITVGNIAENSRVTLLLTDYECGRRLKLWAEAEVVDDDPELLRHLADPAYPAEAERAILLHVVAWDSNCRQHLPCLVRASQATFGAV